MRMKIRAGRASRDWSGEALNEFVQRDRQLAHALARSVIDSVGEGAGNAGDADFSDPARPERIESRVVLGDERHVDGLDVRVDRHVVLGKIAVGEAAIAEIE